MHSHPNVTKRFFWRFYQPLVVSLILFVLALTTSEISPTSAVGMFLHEMELPVYGFDLPLGSFLTDLHVLQLTFMSLSLGLAIYAFSVDVSTLFPNELKFDIYYDVSGIRDKIQELDLDSFNGIKIVPDWEERLRDYEEMIITSLSKLWAAELDRLALIPDVRNFRASITGTGTGTVKLQRIGLLHYKFTSSGGRTNFVSNQERQAQMRFAMEFSLIDKPTSHVQIQLNDLFPVPLY